MVELLERVAQSWPERPSVVLRLAAVAHRLEEGLDERLAEGPARLSALAGRDPWTRRGEAARTVLLAALARGLGARERPQPASASAGSR